MVFGILAQRGSGRKFARRLGAPGAPDRGLLLPAHRPQRNRQRAQQALVASLEVGDDVMTTGGIFGTIVEIDDDEEP